jgi:Flp pilus assembly protein TadG
MIRHIFKDQRGTVILFVAVLIVVLLALGGMAIDIFYQTTVDNELQRSLDFAALAGAGGLKFDLLPTTEAAIRLAAQSYAAANPIRKYNGSTVNLDLNPGNNPTGDIVLGNWDGTTFTPGTLPLDPTVTNAVRCQFATTIPTSFLRILGVNTLQIAAQATAWGPTPIAPPNNACTFPIGVTDCSFQAGGAFNSGGCGTAITFISSSSQGPGSDPGSSNTAAWVNLSGTSVPNPNTTNDAINAAANGSACSAPSVGPGDEVGANNGMQQPVFNNLQDKFIIKYNASLSSGVPLTITNSPSSGPPVPTYVGYGWDVYIPVINTGPTCPPGPVNGTPTITGWTRFVITQVINIASQAPQPTGFGANGRCAVANPADPNSWAYCNDPNLHESFRGVFGYYSCEIFDSLPNPIPGPVTARAVKLQLVK